jgi:DNA (cytosine-5)-methyltransferase 1
MVNRVCERCHKEFTTTQKYTRHQARKTPCKPPVSTQEVQKHEPISFRFIDLFCGIGGFHQALTDLGGTCVLACDIDKECRAVYEQNYNLRPEVDVTKLDTSTMPDFDVLCGGFPCQAFSHAGNQDGFMDIRGTLFMEVVRILKDKQPKYFILENVKNLTAHDNGNTWSVIYRSLVDAGYVTTQTPILVSPHQYGIPQHRERVYILGIRNDISRILLPFKPPSRSTPCSIHDILDTTINDPELQISTSESEVLELWEEFIQEFKQNNKQLPTFPIWTDEWDSTYDISGLPTWKQIFIQKNRALYAENREFCATWVQRARLNPAFSGAKRKLEWQCGKFQKNDSIWTLMFQYRPSGIRMKRPTYAPALVAMAQIPVIGWLRRKMSPREVARLQSFPDTFKLPPKKATCYKQFGNSVNVHVVKEVTRHLLYSET